MSTKVRLTSLFLAVLMFVSVLHAFPPVQVSAASAPTATMTVGKSTLELGSSTSYSGTAKGNGHTFSTVTLGIAYYPTEDDYDDGAAANWVYKRNTNLSASSKTLSGTFKTSSGSYVTGTNNDGTGSRKLYTDKVGFYTITIAAYAASYGSAVQKTKTIEVVEPEEEFDVSKDELEFDSASASKTFKVYASSAYTITKNVSWITLSSTSGSSDKTITVTCKENTSTSPREGTIQVKHTSTGKTYTIDVYQDGKEVYATITNFAISSSTLSSNGSISFSGVINGNGEKITAVQVNIFNKTTHDLGGTFFRAENLNVSTYDLSKVTAITSDVITGSGAYELKLEPGKSYDIVVYAKLSNGNGFENEVLKTFSVIEDLKISTDELEFDADGGKESFVVTASNSFSISESLSWITLSSTSGSSTKTISVTCAENTSNSPREGTIKVKHTSTGKTYTINVYQDGKKVYATITNFAISSSTLSSNGSISFSGVINGNGEKITAVQVNIFNKTTHDLGGTFFRAENLNVSTYDLSKVTAITSDVITGSGAYELKLEPGKSYDIVVYAKLSNGNGFENEVLKTFSVEQNTSPAVNSITASGSYMTYTFTVTCNKYATNGIVLYADEHEMKDISWTKKASGDTVTYTGKFSFSLDGTRTITAYALDSKGNRITDSSKSTTVNVNSKGRVPAPKIKTANPSTIKIGDTLYLTWEKPTANLTYTYNVYVLRNGTNVCVNSSKITGTSYTIPASYFPQEGEYIVSVIAMAENYTQSDDDLASINVNVVKTISTTVGDVNGDGQVTNKDRFVLNRYLAGMAGYENINKNLADINGDGKVNQEDVLYLARHLAGWVGYEKLRELDSTPNPNPNVCTHSECEHVYSGTTVWVNNTIKTNPEHTFYHVYFKICKNEKCRANIGKVQGDIEKEAHNYNSDGVCACGSINITGYTKWNGINATDKRVSVYETPYSTDSSYGQLFVDEQIVVLGKKAGRYLIEYTVTASGGARSIGSKKQGYVNASAIASISNYNIEFKFETITLPVSGREVLLIPLDGSANYYLYNGKTKITDETLLKNNLKINFENKNSCEYGTTTMVGKVGGFGTLSVTYTVNGVTYNLQCPDYYIVADSNSVYKTSQKNIFSEEESEYISMALDMYFSQNLIKIPYELYWSAGENFALCIEELDKILSNAMTREDPTVNHYAGVLSSFIDKYVDAEKAKTTVDLVDQSLGEYIIAILDFMSKETNVASVPASIRDIWVATVEIYNLADIGIYELKRLYTNLAILLDHTDFKTMIKTSPKLASWAVAGVKNAMPLNEVSHKLTALVNNSKFWTKINSASEAIGVAGELINATQSLISFGVTTFGNWQRHRTLLSMMLTAIDSIPVNERTENYDLLRAAIVLLLDQYDEDFWNRIDGAMKDLIANLKVQGVKFLISKACPGAYAVLAVAQLFIGISDIGEEANSIRMRQFYLIMNQAIINEFESLYKNGDTFSSVYLNADNIVKLFLNMAIHTNDIASKVNEYTEADKTIYQKNIERIKTQFKIYLGN